MVESSKKTRADIQKELLQFVDEHVAKWDTLTAVYENKEKCYEARQTWIDGCPLTIVKYKAKGMKQEHFDRWYADPMGMQEKINSKMTFTKLDDCEDHLTAFVKMETPPLTSNRCFILTWYKVENEDGSKVILSSSNGNDDMFGKHQDLVASNVVSTQTC